MIRLVPFFKLKTKHLYKTILCVLTRTGTGFDEVEGVVDFAGKSSPSGAVGVFPSTKNKIEDF